MAQTGCEAFGLGTAFAFSQLQRRGLPIFNGKSHSSIENGQTSERPLHDFFIKKMYSGAIYAPAYS